jgi:hypothetical protein
MAERPSYTPCGYPTRAGHPCPKPRASGLDGCWSHAADPEAKSAAGRRGSLVVNRRRRAGAVAKAADDLPDALPRPDYATAAGVRSYLEQASQAVSAGRLAPAQAQAINAFAQLAVKLAEIELDTRLLDAEVNSSGPTGPTIIIRKGKNDGQA